MNKRTVRVFSDANPIKVEKDINAFLESNLKFKIISIATTCGVLNVFYATVIFEQLINE